MLAAAMPFQARWLTACSIPMPAIQPPMAATGRRLSTVKGQPNISTIRHAPDICSATPPGRARCDAHSQGSRASVASQGWCSGRACSVRQGWSASATATDSMIRIDSSTIVAS